jgi:hypothetical protein
MIELRVLGMKYEDIVKKLDEEGFKVDYDSVVCVVSENIETKFKEELLRRQLADITLAEEPEVRLKWRAHILDKLYPPLAKVEQEKEEEGSMGKREKMFREWWEKEHGKDEQA